MIRDYLKFAIQNLMHRKMRSWLTMIGIFIGITAVVAIISLGQGLQVAINEQFDELGADKIYIQPGTSSLGGATSVVLDSGDLRAIEGVAGVDKTTGMAYQTAQVDYKDEIAFILVTGIDYETGFDLWEEMMLGYVEQGRLVQKGEVSKAFAGYSYAEEDGVFSKPLKLGDKLTVNGHDFEIVGFQEDLGNSMDNQAIHISNEAYERVFGDDLTEDYIMVIVKTAAGEDPSRVGSDIERALRNERNVDEGDEDFSVQTSEEMLESFNSILLIVQVVIIGIAAISLLIGGIGIMNTMYTAVVERTKEIGVMKAIGARNSDVMLLFVIESGMLGLIGGIIGVILGLSIAKLTEIGGAAYVGTPLLRAWWSFGLIGAALAFSFLTGALSGLAPAYQASKQQPVDSLRYE